MEKYKEKLNKYHKYSNISLKESQHSFKEHMNKKQKDIFDYLVKELEKNEILYRYNSQFYIIIPENNYFYFEMFDDLSVGYTDFENKDKVLDFKFKKDVDNFIETLKEELKN